MSLLGPETPHPSIDRHRGGDGICKLTFHDIIEDDGGFHPRRSSEDAEKLVGFFDAGTGRDPMLIHCWAGISRSTAAAFTALCMLKPSSRRRGELAWELRGLSPSATPNRLIVSHADALLGRDGRMVAAVDAIGRGREATEGVPFSFPP